MPTKQILIDGLYKQNIRLAVLVDGKLDQFEFETSGRKNIIGNIYLAKVVRVEDSIQSAFIDYGSGKNGFISLSEINPEYFIISNRDEKNSMLKEFYSSKGNGADQKLMDQIGVTLDVEDENMDENFDPKNDQSNSLKPWHRRYKISDILKKDQTLLVQCIKEERGHKGATFTTYISLVGRYFVVMPNNVKNIGISKKISTNEERKRILQILEGFTLTKATSVVARTAAEGRKTEELSNDYKHLTGLWNKIRDTAISISTPQIIHQDDSLIKRAIKEYVDVNTTEIIIEGNEAFDEADMFGKMFGYDVDINFVKYKQKSPLFVKYGVEQELNSLLNRTVLLPSGASLVIDQTEAFIVIDVNSGRSNTAVDVEETAFKTNSEAAVEIARQIRLRNLSGIVMIDFIDMVRISNKKEVEKILRDAMQSDKAKIQFARISPFGVLELSRQRTQQSFFETSGIKCKHCDGSGYVKSPEYASMHVLRSIAANLSIQTNIKPEQFFTIHTHPSTAIHILNFKVSYIKYLEGIYKAHFIFISDRLAKNEEDFRVEYGCDPTLQQFLSVSDFSDEIDVDEPKDVSKKQKKKKNTSKTSHKHVKEVGFFSRLFTKFSK